MSLKVGGGQNPAKILMVEDNPGDILLLRLALDKHEQHYQLDVLRDGEQAIKFVQRERTANDGLPCVIVLDLHLPLQDGVAVLEAIKLDPPLAHIRVVALTTFASPSEEADVKRLGVRLYKTKPTDLDEWFGLAGAILEVCRESSESIAA